MKTLKQLATVIYKMPSKRYLTYMRSSRWQQVRREHLESVGFMCEERCGRKACQVHHWSYARLGYERPEDLHAVCVYCHHRLHMMVGEPANDNLPKQLDLAL